MPALAICLLHLHLPPMFSLGPLLNALRQASLVCCIYTRHGHPCWVQV